MQCDVDSNSALLLQRDFLCSGRNEMRPYANYRQKKAAHESRSIRIV